MRCIVPGLMHWFYLVKGNEWPGTLEIRVNRDICNAVVSDECPAPPHSSSTQGELKAMRLNRFMSRTPQHSNCGLDYDKPLRRVAREES